MPDNTKPAAANGGLENITVTDWKAHAAGAMRGFLSIILPHGIRLTSFRLFEKNGERWIGMPSEKYRKRDGSTGYAPIIEFESRQQEREFQAAALAALDRYLEEGDHAQ